MRGDSAAAGPQVRKHFERLFSGRAKLGGLACLQACAGAWQLFIDESPGFFDHGEMKGRRVRPLVKAPAF